jgi:hypothetical protein
LVQLGPSFNEIGTYIDELFSALLFQVRDTFFHCICFDGQKPFLHFCGFQIGCDGCKKEALILGSLFFKLYGTFPIFN